MKKLLLFLTLLPYLVFSQMTVTQPDTVCYQSGGSIYEVTPSPGLVYNWSVISPGVITGGQGTNQIQVDWSASTPGLIPAAVQVQAINTTGCLSPVMTLDVFIYNVNVTYIQLIDMCAGSPCVDLIGTPQGGIWTGMGVNANQFCPVNSGVGTFNLFYTYNNAGCVFVNAMQVEVVQLPVLLPIQHN